MALTGKERNFIPTWDIHDRLLKARKAAGMEQDELAQLTGLSRRSIGRYETGQSEPRRSSLILISFATGVSLDWLETGKTPADDNGGGEKWAHWDSNPRPAGIGSKPSDQGGGRVA